MPSDILYTENETTLNDENIETSADIVEEESTENESTAEAYGNGILESIYDMLQAYSETEAEIVAYSPEYALENLTINEFNGLVTNLFLYVIIGIIAIKSVLHGGK